MTLLLKMLTQIQIIQIITKRKRDHYLSGLFQFNSSLPLIKREKDYFHVLKPRLALKLSPDFMKDLSKNDGNRLDVNNIYNLNRLSKNDTLERVAH